MEILEALKPLFNNTESFFKNHKVEVPVLEEEEEEKKEEATNDESKADDEERVSGWDNETPPTVPTVEQLNDTPSNNQNEDLQVNDIDSSKAEDEGNGEHITNEEVVDDGTLNHLIL